MSIFYCCGGSDDSNYKQLRNVEEKRAEEDETPKDDVRLEDLAAAADIQIQQPEQPRVEIKKKVSEQEIKIDVIDDEKDTEEGAPVEEWGTLRLVTYLKEKLPQGEIKRRQQTTVSKVIKRIVELAEAKEQALRMLELGTLQLLLHLLRRFQGLNAIQRDICYAMQYLCLQKDANRFEFPGETGAEPLKEVIEAQREHVNTLIAALDCLSQFCRIDETYVQATLDTGIVPMLLSMMSENVSNEEGFPLQISLTRLIGAIARSSAGRDALGKESLDALMDSMRQFKEIQNLIGNCTEGLWYLCKDRDFCALALDQGLIPILTETMRNRYAAQDLHTKIITLFQQILSKPGLPDKFVEDDQGIGLLNELLVDNQVITENYLIILQVWVALLANASEGTQRELIDQAFVDERLRGLGVVLQAESKEAREACLTLLLIVSKINPRAIDVMGDDGIMVSALLLAPNMALSADAIQCLMVLYFFLSKNIETQKKLFNGNIMMFLASDWFDIPGISDEAVKSAAATLVQLYSNLDYHQELKDRVVDLQNLVAQKDRFPGATMMLDDLDAALNRIGEASSVMVTVDREDEKGGEGEMGEVEGMSSRKLNIILTVGERVEVMSKSQHSWVPGKIRAIDGNRLCVVYTAAGSTREKWLSHKSRQWRPIAEQIMQAKRTRSGTQTRRAPQEEPEQDQYDEEPSRDYAEGEPGAASATEYEAEVQAVNLDVDVEDVISKAAQMRLESPRPPEAQINRPATRRQTLALATEMDFDVIFQDKKLGLELRPGDNNLNCIVSRCLSDFTQSRIDPDAYIIQVNGQWVKDLPFDTIYQLIVTATKNPPLTIMFRTGKDDNDSRFLDTLIDDNTPGTLKVHVVEANQLQTPGRYAKIKLPNEKKSTQLVAPSENPSWTDTLEFYGFVPNTGKTAQVVVYSNNKLIGNNKVGSAKFPLPSQFYRLERHSLQLLDNKEKLTGTVNVTAILTQETDRESHRLRDIRLSTQVLDE